MTVTRPNLTQPALTTILRSSRPKPISFAAGEKKPQQAPVWQSPCKNITELRQKGKMDRTKQLMEPFELDEEELSMEIEEIDADL